jgi:hypothetical protein
MKKPLTFILPALFAMTLPAVALADGRWDRDGNRGDNRGYRYDRGDRYRDSDRRDYGHRDYRYRDYRGSSRYDYNRSSNFSFGLSLGSRGYYNDDYFSLRYSRGYSRAPVVVREYREYRPARYYDCPPPVIYYPSTRVYYGSPGYYSSGGVYYYSR